MGFGASITRPRWILKASVAVQNAIHVEPEPVQLADDVMEAANVLLNTLANVLEQPGFSVTILESVPSHRGLGAKSSLLCGITAATVAVVGAPMGWPAYRSLTRRGGTSGIGINTSVHGGAILDSGHLELGSNKHIGPSSLRAGSPIPNVVARWELRKWPFLLVFPPESSELYGRREIALFRSSSPVSLSETRELAADVLYRLLPALTAGDHTRTHEALEYMQHLALKLREWDAQPKSARDFRDTLRNAGAECVALSSMGPAMAVFGRDLTAMLKALPSAWRSRTTVSSFRNTGVARLGV